MFFFKNFKSVFKKSLDCIKSNEFNDLISNIRRVQQNKGRIFFFGIGGSAANCSHAVNDFRKLLNIESYSPCDNFSEISARINDDGWNSSFTNWLKVSNPTVKDILFFFSVGGGDYKKKVSVNLIHLANFAKNKNIRMLSIVARKNSFLQKNTICLLLKIDKVFLTPVAESLQVFVWHAIVTHPDLKKNNTKW